MPNDIQKLHVDVKRLEKIEQKQEKILTKIVIAIIISFLLMFGIFFTGIVMFLKSKEIDELKQAQHAYAMLKSTDIGSEYKLLEFELKQIIDGMRTRQRKLNLKLYDASERIDNAQYIEQFVTPLYIAINVFKVEKYEIYAILASESEGRVHAIGKTNGIPVAFGPMQVRPETFDWLQKKVLLSWGKKDINNVYDNVEAGITYWRQCKSELYYALDKKPTHEQIAAAYNSGVTKVMNTITNNENFTEETIEYKQKFMFYYTNFKNKNYNVWYYEKRYQTNS